jgi:tripartite-type tricarboxylate transporter receptor subunit TctC
MMSRITIALCCALLAGTAHAADSYPARPVRLIAPFPPGGPTDVLARVIAAGLTQRWNQQVVVVNRQGEGVILGTELAGRSATEVFNVVMGTVATHAINESMYKDLPFKPQVDFAAVALAAQTSSAVIVNPSLPARSFQEFMALAKSKPGRLNYASPGIGTIEHLAI